MKLIALTQPRTPFSCFLIFLKFPKNEWRRRVVHKHYPMPGCRHGPEGKQWTSRCSDGMCSNGTHSILASHPRISRQQQVGVFDFKFPLSCCRWVVTDSCCQMDTHVHCSTFCCTCWATNLLCPICKSSVKLTASPQDIRKFT